MRPHLLSLVLLCLLAPQVEAAEPDFPLTADSKPQPDVPKGEMIKDAYTSNGGIFPGTQREYQLYIPHGLDRSKPAAFMVFQDGVIYQAPVVFDNLIAKKDIPPLIGVFIKPGVVPAANENALPRFNRSYEYDSITDNYSRFLIEEFLPAIEAKHGIKLSTDPNDAAISGNSSGGIAAFMVAWHRSDRFRRVFTGVGTYVGIHGGDRLPVLVRKFEPKPIRIFLQSGTGDNNLYCGDWWMANQMMERSFTWAGYDVNHAWGEGGHNQKHASQIFPDVMRWLWRDWQRNKEIKANPKGESKWKGYEVCDVTSKWSEVFASTNGDAFCVAANKAGDVAVSGEQGKVVMIGKDGAQSVLCDVNKTVFALGFAHDNSLLIGGWKIPDSPQLTACLPGSGPREIGKTRWVTHSLALTYNHKLYLGVGHGLNPPPAGAPFTLRDPGLAVEEYNLPQVLCLSPDQTQIYASFRGEVFATRIRPDGTLADFQSFYQLENIGNTTGFGFRGLGKMCVDTDGRLYVATSLGIEVCDQAGRVNFIILTPEVPHDLCFGGKDLSELFIACGNKVYKRPTKVHGIVSGQMPPIKPAPPKL